MFLIGLLPIVFTSKSFYPSIIGFSSREIKQIIATIIPDFSIPKITPIQPEKIDLDQCDEIPSGYGIPGFKPGIDKNQVFQMFGTPAKIETGYWPNTQAVFYHLIPNRVSLGFLFDKKSGKLRQTEAAFSQEVELKTILITFNSMSGCRLNSTLESGLKMVYNRKDNDYSFAIDSLKGVVERQQSDRIYIGIWEADLH
ncbi:hypothetical protein [Planktothrix agardhii]|uniref:PknD n=1 Tax=Planktothrix agardhii TaxID=1160 RepID=A0AAD1Q1M9_PLAAG|nr:hypothetical protein [Planktothrix agardhii]CAH2572425.1 PknD [Planktothrix rubescens]MCB8784754.1 hypothetical protein [Planktothrix agardhii 1025]MCF3610917.1 hypothetical protein [Planktothrix agardhii 1027]MCF3647414.1 hypothetical protein [Planktothrix agardhii 1026]CAD5926571.1 PknD [Planktothrix agardhii]